MARYADAIEWIVQNDDNEWLEEDDPVNFISVTACLIADVFGKDQQTVVADIQKGLARLDRHST